MKLSERPMEITDKTFRFDSFKDGSVVPGKKCGRLPAMGWNSWNAFGSGNNEELTKAMPFGDSQLGAKQGQDEPGKDALHNPIALPTPVFDFVDRDVATRLAERPNGDDK